jgi:hypothetical protein
VLGQALRLSHHDRCSVGNRIMTSTKLATPIYSVLPEMTVSRVSRLEITGPRRRWTLEDCFGRAGHSHLNQAVLAK